MGLFVWYFGVDRRYDDVAHHTILLGPRYRELVRDIFDRKVLADDFSLYLHRPTATDPFARAAGLRRVLRRSRPCPTCSAGRTGGRRPSPTASASSARSRRRSSPTCRTRSSPRGVTTPLDFQHRLNSYRGAGFALEPILTQSAWFRPHNAQRGRAQSLSRRRGHPSGRGPARRAVFRARSRQGRSACLSFRLIWRAAATSGNAATRSGSARNPSTPPRAFCRPRSGSRPSRSTPSAASPTTRSTSPTARSDALARLRDRLARAARGRPRPFAADRAMADPMRRSAIPPALPEALLEGLAWDAEGRCYETLDDLFDYAARVAGTVGVMMTLIMGVRSPRRWRRACDLGVAMQLTNIARDVGEDARLGRIYLPRQWLREAGVDADAWLAEPSPDPRDPRARRAASRRSPGALPAGARRRRAAAGELPPGDSRRRPDLCRDRAEVERNGFELGNRCAREFRAGASSSSWRRRPLGPGGSPPGRRSPR